MCILNKIIHRAEKMASIIYLKVDGVKSKVCLQDVDFTIDKTDKADDEDNDIQTVVIEDIIAIESQQSSSVDQTSHLQADEFCIVHFIKHHENSNWTKGNLTIKNVDKTSDELKTFCAELKQKFDEIRIFRPKRLLVLLNAIGGKRQAKTMYDTVMTPIFELANISCDLIVSQRPKHFIDVMTTYDCEDVDGIVLMGGDGTVSEVVNVLIKKTQEEAGVDYNDQNAKLKPLPKPIGIIPTGTGNGAAESLIRCQDVLTATLHVVKGKTGFMSILGSYCEDKLIGFSACIFGLLYAAELVHIADRKFRWMRTARYAAVPLMLLIQNIHQAPIEVTAWSKQQHTAGDGGKDEEQIVEKENFTQDCSMIMIWPWAISNKDGKYCVNPDDHNKDEYYAVFYENTGKLAMFKQIYNMSKKADNMFSHPHIRQVTGNAMKIKFLGKDKPAESDPRNLMSSIDGEMVDNQKAEYYIKMIRDVVPAYYSR